MQENGLNKFRTIVSELSSFVGYPVLDIELNQDSISFKLFKKGIIFTCLYIFLFYYVLRFE